MSACTVCDHQQHEAIDVALHSGVPVRTIAMQYGIPKSSVGRHRVNCLPRQQIVRMAMQRHVEEHGAVVIQSTQERIGFIDKVAVALHAFILMEIEKGRQPSLALVRTWLQAQETTLKAQFGIESRGDGRRDDRPHAEIRELVGRILKALESFPDARDAVALALQPGPRRIESEEHDPDSP